MSEITVGLLPIAKMLAESAGVILLIVLVRLYVATKAQQ